MFLPIHDWKIISCRIIELDAAIARRGQDLVFVNFRPGKVVQRILGSEPVKFIETVSSCDGDYPSNMPNRRALRGISKNISRDICLPFDRHNSVRSQLQNIQPAISYKPEIGRACDGQAIVEERRIFNRTSIEALCTVMEHCDSAADKISDLSRMLNVEIRRNPKRCSESRYSPGRAWECRHSFGDAGEF